MRNATLEPFKEKSFSPSGSLWRGRSCWVFSQRLHYFWWLCSPLLSAGNLWWWMPTSGLGIGSGFLVPRMWASSHLLMKLWAIRRPVIPALNHSPGHLVGVQSDNSKTDVYVNCQGGKKRAAALVVSYILHWAKIHIPAPPTVYVLDLNNGELIIQVNRV